tara:strand:+ start:904 stop:1173 length:270 start_codon:yes stop_codon:yes gene_type:complete
MIKELKYALFIFSIFFFVFFTLKFYFSDKNIKNNFRTLNNIESKIKNYDNNIIYLKSDTENIVEYIQNDFKKKNERYKFWDLLTNKDND